MLVSWNIRGLNKVGKYKDINSHLLSLNANVNVLLKTRVKRDNAKVIWDKLKLPVSYLDNYNYHVNGRIWLNCNDCKLKITTIYSIDQMVRCEVKDVQRKFLYWLTVIYTHNKLELQRNLWHDIITCLTTRPHGAL